MLQWQPINALMQLLPTSLPLWRCRKSIPFTTFWFKWLDPCVLLATVVGLILQPQLTLDAFIPPPLSAYDPDQGFLIH